ncbi:MAG: hypothetical protein JWP80_3646, partial [Pseudomonas sp.]|nr:hypothetical protein [Pseudomonas sp.]
RTTVGAAEGCDKAGTAFMGINRGDRFPVDRSLRQLLQEFGIADPVDQRTPQLHNSALSCAACETLDC